MPRLTDIATFSIGKKTFADTREGIYALKKSFPEEELNFATRLRTHLQVGDVKPGTLSLPPSDSKGVYASWRSELEREPIYDLYRKTPLNQVKDTTHEDLNNFLLERKHREWLKEVDERIRRLQIK